LAFFLGVNLASLVRLTLIGAHFAAVYHVLAEHSLPFTSWIVSLLLLYQAAIGLAQAISTLMEHAEAAIVCVGVSVIMASFNGFGFFSTSSQFHRSMNFSHSSTMFCAVSFVRGHCGCAT
jgi:hypothetical protein